MKRSVYIALGALVLMAATTSAFALEGEQLTAKIPFQFTVNEKVMPAGTYDILYADPTDETSMAVRASNGTAEDTFFVEDAAAPGGAAKTELVFDEIGTRHFLRQIWVAGEDIGHQVALSKTEKELMGKGTVKTAKHIPAEHSMHKKM